MIGQENEIRRLVAEVLAEEKRLQGDTEAEFTKRIIAEVLAEQKRLHNNEADEVVLKTISTILTSFGIEEEDRVELRADFQHLRRWRKASEQVERAGWKAIATVLVTGICGLIWLGIQTKFGK